MARTSSGGAGAVAYAGGGPHHAAAANSGTGARHGGVIGAGAEVRARIPPATPSTSRTPPLAARPSPSQLRAPPPCRCLPARCWAAAPWRWTAARPSSARRSRRRLRPSGGAAWTSTATTKTTAAAASCSSTPRPAPRTPRQVRLARACSPAQLARPPTPSGRQHPRLLADVPLLRPRAECATGAPNGGGAAAAGAHAGHNASASSAMTEADLMMLMDEDSLAVAELMTGMRKAASQSMMVAAPSLLQQQPAAAAAGRAAGLPKPRATSSAGSLPGAAAAAAAVAAQLQQQRYAQQPPQQQPLQRRVSAPAATSGGGGAPAAGPGVGAVSTLPRQAQHQFEIPIVGNQPLIVPDGLVQRHFSMALDPQQVRAREGTCGLGGRSSLQRLRGMAAVAAITLGTASVSGGCACACVASRAGVHGAPGLHVRQQVHFVGHGVGAPAPEHRDQAGARATHCLRRPAPPLPFVLASPPRLPPPAGRPLVVRNRKEKEDAPAVVHAGARRERAPPSALWQGHGGLAGARPRPRAGPLPV